MDNKMIDLTNINDSKLDSQLDLESEGFIDSYQLLSI